MAKPSGFAAMENALLKKPKKVKAAKNPAKPKPGRQFFAQAAGGELPVKP